MHATGAPEPVLVMPCNNFVHSSIQLHKAGARVLRQASADGAEKVFLMAVSHYNNMKRKDILYRD
jgi:hypothetical protein